MFSQELASRDNVVVQKETITAFGYFSAAIERRTLASILLLDDPKRIRSFQLAEHFARTVRRTIDHNDDLYVGEPLGLLAKRIQASTKSFGAIERRNDHTQFNHDRVLRCVMTNQ